MNEKIIKNTSSLFVFYAAKILFPFIILPYLTRVLATETYGVVAYVKTIMTYMQIIVDFGFTLSATKDIVKARNDRKTLEYVLGDNLIAKLILGLAAFVILLLLTLILPILRTNFLFTVLSFAVVFLSVFLMDFLFRGLEIMHIITIRFVAMKLIATLLTFLFVKSNDQVLLIPVFDILGSFVAILLVLYEIRKLKLKIRISSFKRILISIKESLVYFLSNAAATSLNALSTIIVGIQISAEEVAYWSVCMQVITAIQAMYNPVTDSIYPEMIKSKNIKVIHKVLKLGIPVLVIGSIAAYFLSDIGMMILGGKEYLVAGPVFRLLIPMLLFGFLSAVFGWPALGAVGKTKETTLTTISSVILHIFMLGFLIVTDMFTLKNLAIVRTGTEVIMFLNRFYYFQKYKELFVRS